MRLDKHLKTKEVEMLALATINIISVDEKVENSQNLAPLRSGKTEREGVALVAFPLQESAHQTLVQRLARAVSARMQEVGLQFR